MMIGSCYDTLEIAGVIIVISIIIIIIIIIINAKNIVFTPVNGTVTHRKQQK